MSDEMLEHVKEQRKNKPAPRKMEALEVDDAAPSLLNAVKEFRSKDAPERPAPKKADRPVTHIVRRRDTWGSLIAEFGPDIAEKNGRTFSSPLVAGTRLEV